MCPTFSSFAALSLNLTSAIAMVATMRVCVNCPRDGVFMLIVWSSLDIVRRSWQLQCLTSTASTPGHHRNCDSSCRVVKFYESPHPPWGCDVTVLGRPSTRHYSTLTWQFILSHQHHYQATLLKVLYTLSTDNWRLNTDFAYSDMWEGRGGTETALS